MPPQDATMDADVLRKAMKGFGTDEAALIRLLAHYPAHAMTNLRETYHRRHSRDLINDIEKETSGHFEKALVAILRGPLQEDCWVARQALQGAGTNEQMLNDVVLARSNADLRAIKVEFQRLYHLDLEKKVRTDLSQKTQRLFDMVLAANRAEDAAPCIPQAIDTDVNELYKATEGKQGTDELMVCQILVNRSPGQLRAISQQYQQRYRKDLESVIRSEFSGHMQDSLLELVRAALDPAMRDAQRLEYCMNGAGTKDDLLVVRLVQMHWNPQHMQQVRAAYQHKYKRDLIQRLKGELSGSYESIMVAMAQ
jgi:annexin A7/11